MRQFQFSLSSVSHSLRFVSILSLFCLIFVSFQSQSVSAFQFNQEWGEYQRDSWSRGLVGDEYNIWTETSRYETVAQGSNYQPLIANIDNNTGKEIIIGSGNYLMVYDYDDGLTLQAQALLNSSMEAQPSITNDYDGDGLKEIIAVFNRSVHVLEYNNSELKILGTSIKNITAWSGIRCYNTTDYAVQSMDHHCYMIFSNSTTPMLMNISITSSGVYFGYETISGLEAGWEKSPTWNQFTPLIGNLEGYGSVPEMIFMIRNTSSTDDNVVVINIGTEGSGASTHSTFSGDGVLQINEMQTAYGYLLYNVDGGGDNEIVVTSKLGTTCYIIALNSDGSQKWIASSGSCSVPSYPAIGDFVEGGGYEVIVMYDGTSTGADVIYVYNSTNGGVKKVLSAIHYPSGVRGGFTTDVDSDGEMEYVMSSGIFDNTGSLLTDINHISFTTSNTTDYHVAGADIDDDGVMDICGSKATTTFCAFSAFDNAPPTQHNNKTYSGITGFYPVACVNTTQTFRWYEQTFYDNENGNYDNDFILDYEYITSNCGMDSVGNPAGSYTTNLENGTSSINAPTFSCYFNKTGVFTPRFYIQDNANPTDFNEYNDPFTIRVIDGDAGIDCNTEVITPEDIDEDDDVTPQQQAQDDAYDETLNILYGSSERIRLMVSIAMIIAIAAAAISYTRNAMAGIIAGMAMTVFCVFFGLLSVWVMLLLIMILALLAVITGFIMKGTAGG